MKNSTAIIAYNSDFGIEGYFPTEKNPAIVVLSVSEVRENLWVLNSFTKGEVISAIEEALKDGAIGEGPEEGHDRGIDIFKATVWEKILQVGREITPDDFIVFISEINRILNPDNGVILSIDGVVIYSDEGSGSGSGSPTTVVIDSNSGQSIFMTVVMAYDTFYLTESDDNLVFTVVDTTSIVSSPLTAGPGYEWSPTYIMIPMKYYKVSVKMANGFLSHSNSFQKA